MKARCTLGPCNPNLLGFEESAFGTPEDIAAAAAFLLSPDARWISGQTLVCDGGRTV